MAIRFEVDVQQNRVNTRIEGAPTATELVEYMNGVLEHPDFRRGMTALVECVDVRLRDLPSSGIHRLADFSRRFEAELGAGAIAVCAPQPVAFGLARMYQLVRDPPYAFAVFRRLEAARAWLADQPALEKAAEPVPREDA